MMSFSRLVLVLCFLTAAQACGREEGNVSTPHEASSRPPSVPAANVSPLPDSAFRVAWGAPKVPSQVRAGQTFEMTVPLRNAGTAPWPMKGATEEAGFIGAIRASHRWWAAGTPVPITRFDDADRVALPNDLRPGEEVSLSMTGRAPSVPGQYEIEFDLVQESVSWFQDKGAKPLRVPIQVQ